jgi:hypothetical protein
MPNKIPNVRQSGSGCGDRQDALRASASAVARKPPQPAAAKGLAAEESVQVELAIAIRDRARFCATRHYARSRSEICSAGGR